MKARSIRVSLNQGTLILSAVFIRGNNSCMELATINEHAIANVCLYLFYNILGFYTV